MNFVLSAPPEMRRMGDLVQVAADLAQLPQRLRQRLAVNRGAAGAAGLGLGVKVLDALVAARVKPARLAASSSSANSASSSGSSPRIVFLPRFGAASGAFGRARLSPRLRPPR